jgi:hypothetical protein
MYSCGIFWNNILKISILGIVYLWEVRIFASQNGGLTLNMMPYVGQNFILLALILCKQNKSPKKWGSTPSPQNQRQRAQSRP